MSRISPAIVILAVIGFAGWFIALPIAYARGQDRALPLWQGFAVVYGITFGVLLFVGLLLALNEWWFRKQRNLDD